MNEYFDFIFSSYRLEQKHYLSAKECIEDFNLVFDRYFDNKKIERDIEPTKESLEKLFRKKSCINAKEGGHLRQATLKKRHLQERIYSIGKYYIRYVLLS